MALQGSLSDFALPDVLTLLASTKKSGELHVDGEAGGEGRIYLVEGKVVHGEAGLTASPVDTLFELLRLRAGSFAFHSDVEAPLTGAPEDVEALLAEAGARLEEWQDIEAVVPSLAAAVSLVADAPASPVVLSAEQWKVLVAVATGGTVGAVAAALGEGEFGACRAVKDLVDAGLVELAPLDPAVVFSLPGADLALDVELEVEAPAEAEVELAGDHGDALTEPTSTDAIDLDSLIEIPTTRRRRSTKAATPEPPGEDADAPASPTRRLSQAAAKKLAEEAEAARVHPLTDRLGDGSDPGADGGADLPGVGHVTAEEAAALEDAGLVDENGEPINRHLLLKFLSSVRS